MRDTMGSSEFILHALKSAGPKFRESFELQTIPEDEVCLTELEKLKSVAARLNLASTRPSIVEWRANLDKPPFAFVNKRPKLSLTRNGEDEGLEYLERTDEERREHLQRSINWVKDELVSLWNLIGVK